MRWYVLQSKPNNEQLICEQLRIREVDVYCPRIRVQPVNPRARKVIPYFPGYLFIRANLDVIGTSVLKWLPGAIRLVEFGGELAYVSDDFLYALRCRVDQVNALEREPLKGLKSGDIVSIQAGPFAGYPAIFDSYLPGHERVRELLQMLRDRQVGLELSAGRIEYMRLHQPEK